MRNSAVVRVCDATGKFMDPTRERAEARIWQLQRRQGVAADTLAAFCCCRCGRWHLGHHAANRMPGTLGEALLAAGVRRG